MRRRVRVKPGKTQSMMGMVVGVLFCLFGLFVAIPIFGLFGVFWTLVALAITVTNGINAFSDKGVASHEIYVDEYEDSYESGYSESRRDSETYADGTRRSGNGSDRVGDRDSQSVKERLATVKKLYEEGVITREEYEEKRQQLIDEI